MNYSDAVLKKQKYFQKTLSDSAVYTTYLRNLDIQPTFASYTWMQLSAFDLSELGLGLLYSILPVDYQPVSVDFTYVTPTPSETLQGIWAKFEPVRFDQLYTWMADMREYVLENFKEEFQPEILVGILPKAIYGVTPYGAGVYDPVVAREFLRATFHRLRLMRKPDISWLSTMDSIVAYLEMIGVTDEHIFNRLVMIFSAQRFAFVLGLSMLGKSCLTETEGDYGVIPFIDAEGNVSNLKFRTLDHLQMGFILGATPLGYGLLLPKESVYKLPEDKKNPPVIKVMVEKIRGIISRLTLSTWSYCYDAKTEVLTEDGFKRIAELTGNERIATLNPETDEIEYQYPLAIHKFKYKGKMIHINGRSIDLLVTPEHKLYVKDYYRERKGKNAPYQFIEAIDLLNSYKYQKYRFKRTAKWNGTNVEYFKLSEYQNSWVTHGAHRQFKQSEKHIPIDVWLRFFAWYISEGDAEKRGVIRIANTNEHNLSEIVDLVSKMGFTPSVYGNSTKGYDKAGVKFNSVQLANYLRQFGKAQEKFIPKWIKQLSSDKLRIFLETLTKGDGHKDARNWKYFTSSRKLADDIMEIALKAGFTASIGEVKDNRYGKNRRLYIVHLDRKRKDTVLCKKPELVDYDGYVYDITVPNHHIILVRRNGKICWSSNSNYNKPEEMLDYHKSQRTNQYDYLQTQRTMVENWVAQRIPKEEVNPVRLRQYQNAVLQAICFRAKRHRWGFGGWKAMTEDQFREWWIDYWADQGLTRDVLIKLYDDMSVWLQPLRDAKLYAGEKIKQIRRRLALLS